MSDRILSKYTGRVVDPASDPGAASPEPDDTEDLGCFGWLRGQKERSVMLELRKRTGTVRAISYARIEKLDFDPSDGITLHAGGEKIRIKGRNLNAEIRPQVRLFQGLTRHRVPWVQEVGQRITAVGDRQVPLTESIEW